MSKHGRFCCEAMTEHATKTCSKHAPHECPDRLIMVFGDGRLGIYIHDGGGSSVLILYCPWCGTEVYPERKRSAHDDFVDDHT